MLLIFFDTPRQFKLAGTMNDDENDEILAESKERTKVYCEPMLTLLKETLRSSVTIFNAKDMYTVIKSYDDLSISISIIEL